eukprot:4717934-Pyramimonas_sp.AAC.2
MTGAPLFAGQHVLVGRLRRDPAAVPDLRHRAGPHRGQPLRHGVRGARLLPLVRAAGLISDPRDENARGPFGCRIGARLVVS